MRFFVDVIFQRQKFFHIKYSWLENDEDVPFAIAVIRIADNEEISMHAYYSLKLDKMVNISV